MSVRILHGDCLDVMRTLPDASVDSIVTDPPYGLSFMGKRWDYDVPSVEVWAECLRVLKPGGHLLAFAGTRTQHRMAVRIEDAGFEIRDLIAWVYSSGFPKSHNLDNHRGKAICGCESASERDLRSVLFGHVSAAEPSGEERGEVLQPGVQEQGVPAGPLQCASAAEGAGQSRLEGWRDSQATQGQLQGRALCEGARLGAADGPEGRLHHGAPACDGTDVRLPSDADGSGRSPGPQPRQQHAEQPSAVPDERGPQARGSWPVCGRCGKPVLPEGLGTALKPALEPITVARKPLAGTVAENVLEHGTGALNIDGCRVGDAVETWPKSRSFRSGISSGFTEGIEKGATQSAGAAPPGRWPANLIHDGSDEVLAAFPDAPGQQRAVTGDEPSTPAKNVYGTFSRAPAPALRGDIGSAARFFYCAKADRADRNEGGINNTHPTVKPTDLMRYLCRLVTPAGGTVLDPFMGSGSTLKAAELEGFNAIGIELHAEYIEIARRRIAADAPLFAEIDA